MSTTVKQLRQIVKRPGDIYLPVVVLNDVKDVQVVKSHVLEILSELDDDAQAPWSVSVEEKGRTYLDVNGDSDGDDNA